MNILILLKSFNYPPRNGGDQAVFNAINRLKDDVHFHLIGTDGSVKGIESMMAFQADNPSIPTRVYDLGKKDKYQRIKKKFNRISNYINNRNGNKTIVDMQLLDVYDAQLDYYYNFYKYLNEYISKNNIDIIQSEFHFTLGFLKGITAPVRKVFIQHEIQFIVEYQRLMQRQHTEEDVYFYKLQRQQEINAMNACDAIITLSPDDKNKLIDNGVHAPIFASFAQITLHDIKIKYPVKINNRLVFIGPESHMPNKQGMKWFLDDVFPLVRNKIPDIKVDVIGRWSEDTIKEWKAKNQAVDFLGFVEDLPQAISNSILIVPLFQGSGIRMKILEACNIGIPFVATSIGAEGLDFTSNENCFIADEADIFAKDVVTLINNNQLANEFINKCVCHIRNKYSNERFVESRMKCYLKVLDKNGTASTMD